LFPAAERAPEESLLLGQTEAYVEYDRSGRVVKGQEVKKRSKYEEDVLINNHSCVWGSWWAEGVWGYACCHSSVRNSYCTGKAGEKAAAETAEQMVSVMEG
jgi:pre-mRNA-processing factor SLU7